jgi:cation-dependent mannose-6-phosphate receptor
MQLSYFSTLVFLLSAVHISAASDKPLKPCTAISPTTDRFFDLNPLHRTPPDESSKKKKEGDEGSWHARGHDYGANFTINFCGPVVEELNNVQDLDKDVWRNVSAYYEKGNKQYALG